jgi:hypothetical protein
MNNLLDNLAWILSLIGGVIIGYSLHMFFN